LARSNPGGPSVILTSDRGSFSDYSRSPALGYFCCMPTRLVPRTFMDRLLAPAVRTNRSHEAIAAPYALRKVEAALVQYGINDVAVVPPEHLSEAIGARTRVVGVTAHDPFGLSPVSTKLTMMFGGGPAWNATYFAELGEQLRALKARYHFRIVAGGPGIWQTSYIRPDWVDTIFQGEGEIDFPLLVSSILSGFPVPATVQGRTVPVDQIPSIIHRSRIGEVQVTRGCPRGCEFCSITPEKYRTIPLDAIRREIAVNMAAGERNVEIVTDDILLYGAKKLRTNHDAAVSLIQTIKDMGGENIGFAHVSAPAVQESPQTILDMGHVAEWDKYRGLTPVVGLETGSTRVFRKYMPAKSFPFKPEQWGEVILGATVTMNEAGIDPCYTMTIGFPDETDKDVEESMGLVQRMIDQGARAYIFPLPVIPISTTRIRGNPMPELEHLPERYWDLLTMCWKWDLRLTRRMLPTIVGRMQNPAARRVTEYFAERLSTSLERVFDKFQESHGHVAYTYRQIHATGVSGVLKSLFFLIQASVRGAPLETPASWIETPAHSLGGGA